MVRSLDGLQERNASYSRRRIKHRNVRFLAFPVFQRSGAPEEIRTPDPQIRSLVLYPAELRALVAHRAGNAPGSARAGGNGTFPIGFPPPLYSFAAPHRSLGALSLRSGRRPRLEATQVGEGALRTQCADLG